MKTIIAVVGESGSGKTWLTRKLHDNGVVKNIVSYTTRAIRSEETDGVEHWFVPEGTYYNCFEGQEMLAYTFFGGNHYWTLPDQVDADFITYVIDERGLVELCSKWKYKFNVVSVYISRPNNPTDSVRLSRDSERISLDTYDYYLENDGTEKFYEDGLEIIEKILNAASSTL